MLCSEMCSGNFMYSVSFLDTSIIETLCWICTASQVHLSG